LWDISTTANWTNSAGAAVVFNPGDNVTLNDTFQNSFLALQSPYLSPGLISYVGSLPMTINGDGNINRNGSIFGLNSSLLINGTGTLTVSNANDFSGGTVISNGILSIATYIHPVGYGTITLAGGELLVPIAAASGVVLSNNIAVAKNSTLEYDGTGGNAFNFMGTLTGAAGQSLIISNNQIGATFNWVRLLKGFTNNANIIIQSPLASVEINPVLNNGDQVFNGTISGTFGRLRPGGGNGSVIFNAQNTYNDSASANATGFSLFMAGGNAGFGADSVSSSPPTIDASPAGTGNIGINVGSDGGNCGFFASGGAHTVGNPIIYTSATNTVTVSIIGNNNLTLSGAINLSGADGTGNTNRTFSVTNTGLTTFSGVISDSGLVCGLIKTGSGTLDLNGANTYTGPTTVSNGILAGIGSIVSPVTVAPAGSIGAGTASVGTLTVNSSLTLDGNGFFKLNKSVSPSNDLVSVSGALANTGTGTIIVTNIGVTAVTNGDTFHLFNKAVTGGNTLTIVGGGMNWTNKLSVDGSIQALSPVNAIANYSTNISYTLSGGNLTINWPTTHLGWILQVQTNALSVGLTTPTNTWHDIPESTGVTSTNFTVNPANPTVFYRLRHP
jgi:autotransporter-associated beta strand protein